MNTGISYVTASATVYGICFIYVSWKKNSVFKLIAAIFHEKTGKVKMIFGGICIVAGIIMFGCHEFFMRPTRRSGLLEYLAHELGRYGFALIYIIPGIALTAWGFIQWRNNNKVN